MPDLIVIVAVPTPTARTSAASLPAGVTTTIAESLDVNVMSPSAPETVMEVVSPAARVIAVALTSRSGDRSVRLSPQAAVTRMSDAARHQTRRTMA